MAVVVVSDSSSRLGADDEKRWNIRAVPLHVLVDGVDLRAMELSALRTLTAVAFEDATLFSDSVRSNVLLGADENLSPEAAEDLLALALRTADADFVHDLPQGVDTRIGEEGMSLSGGQRQRVAGDERQLGQPSAAHCQHADGEIGRHHGRAGLGEGQARGAGAGGQIEDQIAGMGVDRRHHHPPPPPVLAQGQHVVGQVVARRDVVEHPGDVVRTLVEAGAVHGVILAQGHRAP